MKETLKINNKRRQPNEETGGFIITSKDGKSRRSDGKPLTDYDLALLAGRDRIAEQIAGMDVKTTAISKAYSEKFDHYADVAHPSIFFLPAFGSLLEKAIARNSPLTQQEVEAVFGDPGWDW